MEIEWKHMPGADPPKIAAFLKVLFSPLSLRYCFQAGQPPYISLSAPVACGLSMPSMLKKQKRDSQWSAE
jgi:hypothetical protein